MKNLLPLVLGLIIGFFISILAIPIILKPSTTVIYEKVEVPQSQSENNPSKSTPSPTLPGSRFSEEGHPGIISPTKMNVLYIGVDNPLSVTAANVPRNTLELEQKYGNNLKIKKRASGIYDVSTNQVGKVTLGFNQSDIYPNSYDFRVKKIPDPVVRLGGNTDGRISKSELLKETGLRAELDDFDFDARCVVAGFTVQILRNIPAGQREDLINVGQAFSPGTIDRLKSIKKNDFLFFTNVRVKCPGDKGTRKVNPLIFKIK